MKAAGDKIKQIDLPIYLKVNGRLYGPGEKRSKTFLRIINNAAIGQKL